MRIVLLILSCLLLSSLAYAEALAPDHPYYIYYSVGQDCDQDLKAISDQVVKGKTTLEDKVLAIQHFVHEKITPVGNTWVKPDFVMSSADRLNVGVGWCNHMASIFCHMASLEGITTRLLYLMDDTGNSPHTIAEALDGDRWVIIDPLFDLEIRNSEGKLATRQDLQKDLNLIISAPAMQKRKVNNNLTDKMLADWLKCYTNRPMQVFILEPREKTF